MSMRSRSPDDNSSLLSASSLDSALNHSRDDDELRALVQLDATAQPGASGSPGAAIVGYLVEEPNDDPPAPLPLAVGLNNPLGHAAHQPHLTEFRSQRNSNESGFVSMHSIRGSMLSTAAAGAATGASTTTTATSTVRRSSEHCTAFGALGGGGGTSVKSASCHFSDVAQHLLQQQHAGTVTVMQQHHQHHHQQHTSSTATAGFLSASSSTATAFSSHHSSSSSVSMLSTTGPASAAAAAALLGNSHSFEQFRALSTDDGSAPLTVAESNGGEEPPALPVKTRQTSASSLSDAFTRLVFLISLFESPITHGFHPSPQCTKAAHLQRGPPAGAAGASPEPVRAAAAAAGQEEAQ